jgi:hypothetical protein
MREGQAGLTLDVRANACDRDFRHFECVSQKILCKGSFGSSAAVVVEEGKRKSSTGGLYVGGDLRLAYCVALTQPGYLALSQ